MFAIEWKNLSKVYKTKKQTFVALENSSYQLQQGQSLSIIGESGSGKTTLARLLLGLVFPSKGNVHIFGKPRNQFHYKELSLIMQMIFQNPSGALPFHMKVETILAEPFKIHQKAFTTSTLKHLLQQVELPEHVLSFYPHQLSGGQKQRVSIARALSINPKILICDEPTSALDASIQKQIVELLAQIQKECSLTLIFISHHLGVVQRLCDEILVLKQGKTVEQGNLSTVFSSSQNAYTQSLIEAASFFSLS